jgi:hypothetical protein
MLKGLGPSKEAECFLVHKIPCYFTDARGKVTRLLRLPYLPVPADKMKRIMSRINVTPHFLHGLMFRSCQSGGYHITGVYPYEIRPSHRLDLQEKYASSLNKVKGQSCGPDKHRSTHRTIIVWRVFMKRTCYCPSDV